MNLSICSSQVKLRPDTLRGMLIVILFTTLFNTASHAHCKGMPTIVNTLPAIELPPAFSIDTLIDRLKDTKAIGLFTKLALKGDVEDLMDEIKKAESTNDLETSRSQFDGLVLKTLALLDDKDPTLAEDIYVSREQIWESIIEDKT